MVSAVFDELREFSLQLTEAEITLVNDTREAAATSDGKGLRRRKRRKRATRIPWISIFQYGNGKGKQDYWDGVKFQEQCIDFTDVLEIIYPGMQKLLEVHQSLGQLKEQSDGLKVNAMGMRW